MTNQPIRCPQCDQPLTQVGLFWICPQHGPISQDKPFTPLRIFLSYGHDDNEELVRRIKADLEERGHDVWFDKSEIKAGDDWRRSITDGVTESDKFVSFLSKHSTRDPGVCRDEIAIAIGVKGGNIQTILVESEQEVQPPVNIGHIQWLDMHDWKEHQAAGEAAWEEWYQAKLAEIVRVVESDESRRFAGEIETLNGHLKPIKSEARIWQLLNKGFYGRQWLFEAVEKWRQDAKLDSRLFWIMGAPGVGKSAFAAQLTHTRGDTVIAAQFCEWDKPNHRNAPRVVRSLAFQLATRLPDYRKLLLILPEIAELDGKDAAELFSYLLANPLRSVINGGRQRYLIVIDALDEAGEAGRNPLVEMLARNAQHLPNWLGLVVTSRPEFDVKTPLQALNPFPLDTQSESNRADIRDYLRRELATHLQNRPDADRLVEQILELSEGVFLYVERFCDDVHRGHLSLDSPEQFPQGLGGIFCQYFQRQFPDMEKFRKDVRPALRAILAAREPLPVEILQSLFNWQDEEVRDFTRPLASLFPVTSADGHDVIKPYHKSLADWLANEVRAGAYFVRVPEGHQLLADLGWRQFHEGVTCMSPYAMVHLPKHLLATAAWKALCDLLLSEDFIRARKQCESVDLHRLLEDFREALTHLPSPVRKDLWRASPNLASLALRGVGKLLDSGELEESRMLLDEARGITLPQAVSELSSLWYRLAGRLAVYDGKRDEAERCLSEALRLARAADDGDGVAKTLLAIGVLFRRFGDVSLDAQDFLEESLEAASSSGNVDLRARIHLNLSMVHVRAGQALKATDYLSKARDAVEMCTNPLLKAWLLKYEGFVMLIKHEFRMAHDCFKAAQQAFTLSENQQESHWCQQLSTYSLIPELCAASRGRIEQTRAQLVAFSARASSRNERGISDRLKVTEEDLDRLLQEFLESSCKMPDQSNATRILTSAASMQRLIGELERNFDQRPPSSGARL